ncbi:hypothetical protein ACFLR4_04825 [Bacteroidota bacterium]
MKRVYRILVLLFFMAICFNNSTAQTRGFGIGVIVGEPTGISLKLWNSGTTAFDAGIAWSLGKDDKLHLHADHLWHNFNVFRNPKMALYYGIGGRIYSDNDTRVGVRGVIGINYFFTEVPLDAFLEIVPVFQVLPDTKFGFNAGIGMRFFFD